MAERKVINEERVPIRGGLGAIGGDDTRGWMPRRLSPRLAPPQGPEAVPELEHIDRRGEVGKLCPLRRQRTLRRLRRSGVLGHSLALGGFVGHGGCEGRGTEYSKDAATASKGEGLEEEEEGDGGYEIEEDAGGK